MDNVYPETHVAAKNIFDWLKSQNMSFDSSSADLELPRFCETRENNIITHYTVHIQIFWNNLRV
jgi:hypothetical protein